mmetsp:Transcript_45411/g.125922  ORF Transcript_45411/g.125922 Transcript_45411/m.125922 type:complete len:354 (+) Transcript_45411:63-1124(+)
MGNTSSSSRDRRSSQARNSQAADGAVHANSLAPPANYPGTSAYPGAYPGALPNGQTIPMNQLQSYFLEAHQGMRPDLAQFNFANMQRQAPAPTMQRTFTIRNDVNLKKNSLKLVRDEAQPTNYHLEFVFDASTDCRISVHYAAVEHTNDGVLSFSPLKDGTSHPLEHREKGLGQTFRTRASHPLDTALYKPEELVYDPKVGRYPIIVCMEAGAERNPDPNKVQSQTTVIKLSKADDGVYSAQPIKQKIQVGSTPYELQEIFGIDQHAKAGESSAAAADGGDGDGDGDGSRECVICMTEARDTTVLPCRHMCMCSDCARQLRVQSNKCPICRTNIEQLLQIKISKQDGADAGGT